ncbi:hypothetical protein [Planctomicrobium sp. SH527]|uniref:hypothetical protein n=1 Tax=Planctomicrobium sp. SH527 TaxID=3448123 RepID=UPI003F5BBEA2
MIRTREHLAWHVAGHAYAATMYGFPVHKLSLDGFTEADLANRGDAQRLDPCTMICIPEWATVPGPHAFAKSREALLSMAIAGPAVELLHREIPCVVPNVEQFTDDWTQALNVAESLWPDENLRRSILDRWVTSSQSVYFCKTGSFFESVIPRLLDRGVMTGSEVQAAWDQMKARKADHERPQARKRTRPRLFEWSEPEWQSSNSSV